MKISSLKKNFIYNIIYQILIIIAPLITTPYIARTIGVNGVGIFSYTYAIVQYFVIFSMLGINNYGNRLIAKSRNNITELSKNFSSLLVLHFMLATLVIIVYYMYIILSNPNYKIFLLLQSIYLISALFDINWLFFGLEKFKTTITRNILIKIISIVCIFTLVKTKNDLIVYFLILSFGSLISQLALYPFIKKEKIKFIKPTLNELKKHIKPLFILFIPIIALSIYKLMDKVMLGKIIDINEVGYYEYGERIINLPMAIITALGTIMLPRISNLISQNKTEEVDNYINKSIEFIMFLSFPMCFGIITIASTFVKVFLGNEFINTINIVELLAITIPIISFANVLRTQYLIPNEKDKEYIISIILGAIVNFILNIILIKQFKSIGACIATIFAELVVMIYQTYKTRKNLPIKKYVKTITIFFIKSVVMYLIIKLFNFVSINDIMIMIIQILIGIVIYALLNLNYIKKVLLKS